MSTSQKVTVAVMGDSHSGSTLGLMNPKGIQLDQGQKVLPSVFQEWLWGNWKDYIKRVKVASRGSKLYVIVNGDIVDGKPHNSVQVVTDNMRKQCEMSIAALEPLASLADRLFVVRGTAAHEGPESQRAEGVAQTLGAEVEPSSGNHTWYELSAIFGGVKFDVTHHPKYNSKVPWMRGGAATRIAADAVMQYAGRGEMIPNYVIRSHFHMYQDSGRNVKGCRGIIMPAWQLRTEYAHRIGVEPADVGGLIIRCDNGKHEFQEVLYEVPTEKAWEDN